MLWGFRWLALAAVVATAALVGPTAAFACDGSGSAVAIYTQCVPKAGGTKKHHHPAKQQGTPTQSTQSTYPVVTPQVSVKPVQVSKRTKRALDRAGKDKKVLQNLASNPNYVENRVLASSPMHQSKLGSTFDLGTGPMLLFALLAGTVLVLLGVGGVRSWRNRHRV